MVETGIVDILKDKKNVKTLLAKRLGFFGKLPLVVFNLNNSDGDNYLRNKKMVKSVLEAWGEVSASAVVINGDGIALKQKNVVIIDKSQGVDISEVLVAGDILIDFSNMKTEAILFNRLVPISQKRSGLTDYSPIKETGNAFIYKDLSALAIFGALNRALETSRLKYDWKQIVKDLV